MSWMDWFGREPGNIAPQWTHGGWSELQRIAFLEARVRDLQQSLRTEREARQAAEESRDAYRSQLERSEAAMERLIRRGGVRIPDV